MQRNDNKQKISLIVSRENPSVKHYRRLRDNKKARQTEKLFVIEGLRLVRDALQYPLLVKQIFITESFQKKQDVTSLLSGQDVPELSVKLLLVSDAIGREMADTEHAQGIFAICRMPEQKSVGTLLRPDGKYLVLCHLQDPGNMGMILRTCDALGTDAVLTTGSCEVYNPKTIRSAMGSALRVPMLEIPDAMQLLQLLQEKHITNYAAVPAAHAIPLTECRFQGGCAVWIGNEGNGLPDNIITACEYAVTIPMRGGAESFNAAMAAGILTWEMQKI